MWANAPGRAPRSPTAASRSTSRSAPIVAGGMRLSLPADDDRRLTDSKWHHLAVTDAGGTLHRSTSTARRSRPPPGTLDTADHRRADRGAHPRRRDRRLRRARRLPARARRRDDRRPLRRLRQPGARATARRPSRRSRRPPRRDDDHPPDSCSGRLGELPGDVQRVTRARPAGRQRRASQPRGRRQRRHVGARRHAAAAARRRSRSRSSSATRPATSARRRRTWTVANAAPAAPRSTLDKTDGALPLTVRADVGATDPDGDPLTYWLDFGDGDAAPARCRSRRSRTSTRARARTPCKLTVSDGTATRPADRDRHAAPRRAAEGRRRRRPRRRGRASR